MTAPRQDPVPRDPPAPPGSRLEALVDGLGTEPDESAGEVHADPGAEPPDA